MDLETEIRKENIFYYFEYMSCCPPTMNDLRLILGGIKSLREWKREHICKKMRSTPVNISQLAETS